MLTRHTIEHKRANNPYRCTIDGCLDSYAEKRKLIAHLNYKHIELSKKEREIMIMKGDELLKKQRNILIAHLNYKHIELSKKEREIMIMKGDELLKKQRNISLNGSSTYYSKLLPIISPTIDIRQQTIIPLHLPSLSQAETISISVTTTKTSAANNDQSLKSLSTDTTDIISTNHILKNTLESNGKGNEILLKRTKSGMVHFDNVNITPFMSNSTALKALKCSQTDMTHSLSIHNNLVKIERDKKLDVTTPSTIILKQNSGNRSLTVRELLGLNVTNKRKIKCIIHLSLLHFAMIK
uniref:C2H2-type domain-containing protein n=1 Tax=Wuchereria bancrofti TaxID=6293 RepID=A0A1I8EJX2_WUCBA